MRALLGAGLAILLAAQGAYADGFALAGSLWQCTRATDRSRFVITFYPGGGVGGGEFEKGEVSPYGFDASRVKESEWPGHWDQTGERFTWSFPDQKKEITGSVRPADRSGMRLVGSEVSAGERSAVECSELSRLPKIGENVVIPRDSRFIDLEGDEGVLKVPLGISLQEPAAR
jgi:hypothetical protein